MFDSVCALPLTAELFAQAVHPTEPLLAVGLSSGHVSTLRLPPLEEDALTPKESSRRRGSGGTDIVDTTWRTKRHEASCRCLSYSLDGLQLYSAGSDGLVKAADSTTGQVTGKVAIPSTSSSAIDAPTVIHALSPQTLLLATDSGALHLYDLRDPAPSLPIADTAKTAFGSAKPSATHHPHTDYISSLTPLPASSTSTSGFPKQWLSTGGTTLALTDLRRGVLVQSSDQEELLLSSLYVTGLPAKKSSGSQGEKALVGGGDGVITLWEKGQWDDQDERIVVSKERETIDALVRVPEGVGGFGKNVACGLGDGKIRFVRLGQNQVVGEVQHDEVEGVTALDFDVEGRMISGGGSIVKVWREAIVGEEEEDDGDSDEEVEGGVEKRAVGGSEEDSSDEEAKEAQRPKKRRKGKGNANGGAAFSFGGLD